MKRPLTYDEALHKAAALCTRSEKCEFDIHTKLIAWEISEENSTKIINYLKKEKYIDNARFCSFFVKDKSRFNKWGKIKIAYALRGKKINSNLIEQALEEINEEDTLSILLSILTNKSKTIKYKDNYDKKAKLIRFALSRGFEMSLITIALKKII